MFLKSSWKPLVLFLVLFLGSLIAIAYTKFTLIAIAVLGFSILLFLILQIYLMVKGEWTTLLINLLTGAMLLAGFVLIWPLYSQVATTLIMKRKLEPEASADEALKKIKRVCAREISLHCPHLENDAVELTGCLYKDGRSHNNKTCLNEVISAVVIRVDKSGQYKGVKFPPQSELRFEQGQLINVYLSENASFNGIQCNKGYAWFYGLGGQLTNCVWGQEFVSVGGITYNASKQGLFFKTNGKIRQGVLARDTTINGITWAKGHLIELDDDQLVTSGTLAAPAIINGKHYSIDQHYREPLKWPDSVTCMLFEKSKPSRCEELVATDAQAQSSFAASCKTSRGRLIRDSRCPRINNKFECRPLASKDKLKTIIYFIGQDESTYEQAKSSCLSESGKYDWIAK